MALWEKKPDMSRRCLRWFPKMIVKPEVRPVIETFRGLSCHRPGKSIEAAVLPKVDLSSTQVHGRLAVSWRGRLAISRRLSNLAAVVS